MFCEEQVEHYRAFGFVVLGQQLDRETVEALSDELDAAFRDAFGSRFEERPDTGGISGHYLPVMSLARTPLSLSLIERLHPLAARLLGGNVLPSPAEAILLFDQAAWHDDTGFDVTAVKFACYLEPLTAENGALRVLPGSHLDHYRDLVKRFDRRVMAQSREELATTVERLPAYVCATQPGDVIAFDQRLYHASINGRDRRQWTVSFYRDPQTEEDTAAVTAALRDEVAADYGSYGEYDPTRYPFYDPEWISKLEQTWHAPSLRRLRELGILDAASDAIEGTS